MRVRDIVGYAVLGLLVVAVGAMVLGKLLGQPILLGFVRTGSMAPTMQPGDGFIAIPAAIAGPPDVGDVVVFQAQELQGGGLTTHRIVGQTEAGFITQGDANPFPDQDGVEPPVTRSQIVAVALQINGQVVVIPNLGTAVQAIQGGFAGVAGILSFIPGFASILRGEISPISLVFIGSSILLINAILSVVGGDRAEANRSTNRSNYFSSVVLFAALIAVILVPATASMVVGSGATTLDIVSSENPNDDPLVIGAGESNTIDYQLSNGGLVPMIVVIESDHEDLRFNRSVLYLSPRSSATTNLTIEAPSEIGAYSRTVTTHRYLPLLPQSIILSLHRIHPVLAIAAIDCVLLVSALGLGVAVIGLGSVRLRTTKRNISLIQRLKRRFL